MDVANLLTAIDEKGNPTESRACVVADDIDTLVSGSKSHASIYFVFTEKLILSQPFKLLFYNKNKKITGLKASFALQEGYPMWDMNKKTAPQQKRSRDDYIKLDFFRPKNGNDADKIVYTFTDVIIDGRHQRAPDMACVLKKPEKKNMNLYVTLPLADTSVHVLSEKSFSSFIDMRKRNRQIPLNRIECRISFGYCLSSMLSFSCGRCVCQDCWNKHVDEQKLKSNKNSERCLFCSTDACKKEDIIRLKLRQGPCPIDMCSDNQQNLGIVLLPCNCHIYCEQLRDVVLKCESNYDPLLRKMPYCPYDACRKVIKGIRIIKD